MFAYRRKRKRTELLVSWSRVPRSINGCHISDHLEFSPHLLLKTPAQIGGTQKLGIISHHYKPNIGTSTRNSAQKLWRNHTSAYQLYALVYTQITRTTTPNGLTIIFWLFLVQNRDIRLNGFFYLHQYDEKSRDYQSRCCCGSCYSCDFLCHPVF